RVVTLGRDARLWSKPRTTSEPSNLHDFLLEAPAKSKFAVTRFRRLRHILVGEADGGPGRRGAPYRTRPAPSAARQARIHGRTPWRARWRSAMAFATSSTASARTRLIVQPPKPPPIMRLPSTPRQPEAASTSASSSGQLTS